MRIILNFELKRKNIFEVGRYSSFFLPTNKTQISLKKDPGKNFFLNNHSFDEASKKAKGKRKITGIIMKSFVRLALGRKTQNFMPTNR
jgi:hypothetical protein